MAHEIMFDEDDPVLAQVRTLALALPDSDEKVSHGRPAFFTKKVFAYYGGSVKNADGWVRHDQCLVFLPDPEDQRALEEDPRSFSPAYLGPYGWMGLDLDEATDWTEIAELLESSFRLTAPKRTIARLDQARNQDASTPP